MDAGIYTPLTPSQIRLVRLEGVSNGILSCRLIQVERTRERTRDLNYCAVSYTWDPSTSIWYDRPDQVDLLYV